MRSHSSSSSGDGGLWLVRMALTPIFCMICNWRSVARDSRLRQGAKVVMVADAVELAITAVQQEAASRG